MADAGGQFGHSDARACYWASDGSDLAIRLGVTLPLDSNDQPDEEPPLADSVENTPTLAPMRMPAQEVVPTEEWANFYGLGSTLNGQPLPVGVVIRAYDPQGVVCGQFRVTRAGCYGLMPVYGDDPLKATCYRRQRPLLCTPDWERMLWRPSRLL